MSSYVKVGDVLCLYSDNRWHPGFYPRRVISILRKYSYRIENIHSSVYNVGGHSSISYTYNTVKMTRRSYYRVSWEKLIK